ncbi:MAG: hypothetical protein R3C53_16575 [Pirellulaceae bacterium]
MMKRLNLIWTIACFALCLASSFSALQLRAQDTPESNETVERTIYVPFAELEDVFEREGRGVFLPYEQFEKLWNAARVKPTAESGGPPVNSIISAVNNEAVVEKDVVRVSAVLTIELLKEGWNHIPLRLADAAILSATIGDEPARILPAAGGGYQLLVENPTADAQQIELKLTYARAFEKSPGKNSVSFSAPQAPVNRWKIRIPQVGVKVNVDPMIAATEENSEGAPANSDIEPNTAKDPSEDGSQTETVLLAFVGATPRVTIDWTPKAEGATGLDALVSVQVQQEIFLSEGTQRTRANISYEVSRAQISELAIEVPAEHKVVNVFDQNVRKWNVSTDGDVQTVAVELFEPATTLQRLSIELEKFDSAPDETSTTSVIAVPKIRAVGVGRQQGTIFVHVDPDLRAEITARSGLLQMDVNEFSSTPSNDQSWTLAFRYASLPYELKLNIEKVQPRITVQQLVEMLLAPEQIDLKMSAVYNIEQAGVFQLDVQIPAGYEVQQVVGREINGAAAAVVDTFQVVEAAPESEEIRPPSPDLPAASDATGRSRLLVNLGRKALGRIGLFIAIQRRLDDPNLLTPTGNTTDIITNVPQAEQEHIARATGNLVVFAPESLRLVPNPIGLRSIAVNEAYAELPSCGSLGSNGARAVLGYSFTDQAAELKIAVERRKPFVTARQRLLVQVEEGVVKYESLLLTHIQFSGIKGLRVDVPSDIAADIRNVSGKLREVVMSPQPNDVLDGYTAWQFTGETELLGNQTLRLVWESKIPELTVGSSQTINVPRIVPQETDRAWGQIVITKSETLDVEATGTLEGLRPIDPNQDVMPEGRVSNAARALEFYDAWSLQLTATRYQLEELKRTSIERGVVRTVATRSGVHNVQALYRIRSARQRLALKLPAGVEFDAQPVRINGNPVALERGDQDMLTIPLIGQDADRSFLLDLRYTLAGSYQRFAVPEFPEDPAVQKVYLAVYLPDEIKPLHTAGPWTEEFEWRWEQGQLEPIPNLVDAALTKWVSEGLSPSAGPMFQTDGRMFLASALRPESTPSGDLVLFTMHERMLAASTIGACLLLGLLFLRSSLGAKLAAVTGLLIVAVACGVLAPTLGRQLLGLPAIAGLIVVGIAWWAWHAYATYKSVDWQQAFVRRAAVEQTADESPPNETPDFEPFDPSSTLPAPDDPESDADDKGGSHV